MARLNRRIIWSDNAEEDLLSIWRYGADEWSAAAADEHLGDMRAQAACSQKFPSSANYAMNWCAVSAQFLSTLISFSTEYQRKPSKYCASYIREKTSTIFFISNTASMTRLLDEAIEHLHDLPEEEQDSAAEVVLAFLSSDERQYRLLPHQVSIQRIQRALQNGSTRLATGSEIERVRKKSRI